MFVSGESMVGAYTDTIVTKCFVAEGDVKKNTY